MSADLVERFIADRDALGDDEIERLRDALAADPALTERLKNALILDEAASRLLLPERGNFLVGLAVRLRLPTGDSGFRNRLLRTAHRRTRRRARRHPAARSATPFVLAAAAVVVAVSLVVVARQRPARLDAPPAQQTARHHTTGRPAAVTVDGSGVVLRRDGGAATVSADTALRDGDVIAMPAGGRLRLADGSRVDFIAGSSVTLAATAPRLRIALDAGALTAEVPPDAGFDVRASLAEVAVAAGRTSVDARGAATRVAVADGRALVRPAAGGDVWLAAGERWPALPPPERDLVAWWTLDDVDGGARDAAGRNHGRLDGGASVADGRWGGAVALNGGLVRMAALQLGQPEALTLMAWVRLEAPTRGVQYVVGGWDEGPRLGFAIGGEDTATPGRMLLDGSRHGGPVTATRARIDDGRWHHLAWIWRSGGKVMLFVDGAKDIEVRLPADSPVDWQGWIPHLGASGSQGGQRLRGSIDDVRIYRRAMKNDDVGRIAKQPPTP